MLNKTKTNETRAKLELIDWITTTWDDRFYTVDYNGDCETRVPCEWAQGCYTYFPEMEKLLQGIIDNLIK